MNLQLVYSLTYETAFKDVPAFQTQKLCMIFQIVLRTYFDFTQTNWLKEVLKIQRKFNWQKKKKINLLLLSTHLNTATQC